MQQKIKAIETRHAGCLFRSRLEARWAVFFDAVSLEWMYEPEGYDLGNGLWYLPDFWLPSLSCFIEVKGVYPDKTEINKAYHLSRQSGYPVHIAFGDIPAPDREETGFISFGGTGLIWKQGNVFRIYNNQPVIVNKIYTGFYGDYIKPESAYTKARSERFKKK